MRVFIIFSLLTLFLNETFGQKDLREYIPSKQTFVVTINGASLFGKVNDNDYKNLAIYQDVIGEIKSSFEGEDMEDRYYRIKNDDFSPVLLLMGDEFGLENKKQSYFFSGSTDSINYTCSMIPQLDNQKFVSFIKGILSEEEFENVVTKNGYQYYNKNDFAIAWNKDVAFFMDYYSFGFYDYLIETPMDIEGEEEAYYESYEERYKDMEKKRKEREQKKLESALDKFFLQEPQLSIKYNEHYLKATEENYDVSYFINGFNNMAMGGAPYYFGMRGSMEKMMGLYADNYTYINLNFEEDEIKVQSNQHVSERFLENTKKANKAKFNKKLLKYIDASNLIGVAGAAIKPEPAYELLQDTYTSVMEGIAGEEAGIGMEIFFTLLDEEEVFDLIKGNSIFAITDIKEFDVAYSTYEYDEDFNRTEITKTKKELFPEFVFATEIGNEELYSKFIRLLEKSEMLVNKGDYYKYQDFSFYRRRGNDGIEIFTAIKDDILIITNDYQLVSEQLEKGVEKSKQVSGNVSSLIKKNNLFAYWEPNETFGNLEKELGREMKDYKKFAEGMEDTFDYVKVEGIKNKGNLFQSYATVVMKPNEKHSILSMLNFINNIYLSEK